MRSGRKMRGVAAAIMTIYSAYGVELNLAQKAGWRVDFLHGPSFCAFGRKQQIGGPAGQSYRCYLDILQSRIRGKPSQLRDGKQIQVIFRGKVIQASHRAQLPEDGWRKPMHKGHDRVELDREPQIRRSDKDSLAGDTPRLAKEIGLPFPAANVLQDRTGVQIIERAIWKGKRASVRAYKMKARIQFLKKRCIVNAGCRDSVLVRIPGFKVVRMTERPVACRANVQNCVRGLHACYVQKRLKHLPPLVAGEPVRERIRPGQGI